MTQSFALAALTGSIMTLGGLIAQTLPSGPAASSEWASLVTNLGFGGFVMWFAWHTQTHTIPALLLQHRQEREASRLDYLGALTDSRKDFIASRSEDRADHAQLVAAVTKLTEFTAAHVNEARAVWDARGDFPRAHRGDTPAHAQPPKS